MRCPWKYENRITYLRVHYVIWGAWKKKKIHTYNFLILVYDSKWVLQRACFCLHRVASSKNSKSIFSLSVGVLYLYMFVTLCALIVFCYVGLPRIQFPKFSHLYLYSLGSFKNTFVRGTYLDLLKFYCLNFYNEIYTYA